jgi:hypothetical protein
MASRDSPNGESDWETDPWVVIGVIGVIEDGGSMVGR